MPNNDRRTAISPFGPPPIPGGVAGVGPWEDVPWLESYHMHGEPPYSFGLGGGTFEGRVVSYTGIALDRALDGDWGFPDGAKRSLVEGIRRAVCIQMACHSLGTVNPDALRPFPHGDVPEGAPINEVVTHGALRTVSDSGSDWADNLRIGREVAYRAEDLADNLSIACQRRPSELNVAYFRHCVNELAQFLMSTEEMCERMTQQSESGEAPQDGALAKKARQLRRDREYGSYDEAGEAKREIQASLENTWLPMRIQMGPFERSRLVKRVHKEKLPGFSGAISSPWRMPPVYDGRICKSVKRGRGGTLLIDVSGSMRWTSGLLAKIMEASPEATVATYCGNGIDKAVLHIVATKGRIAGDCRNPHQGAFNSVDGPALRWLVKQQGPRYWLSDGQINGAKGGAPPSLGMLIEVAELVRRGRVIQVPSCAWWLEEHAL